MKYEKEYKIRLVEDAVNMVEFVSRKLANGKRVHELELINILLDTFQAGQDINLFKELKSVLLSQYGKNLTEKQKISIINVLTNEFPYIVNC